MISKTTISESDEKEFTEFLHARIREFNNQKSAHHLQSRQPGAVTPLNLILKDESGHIIGGLAASTFWDWLEIDDFFIPEQLRGQGLGATLLQTAEQIARQRGCKHCYLSTFEFQARSFYELHGFYITGQLEDYPPGSCFYWMRKDLEPDGASHHVPA